MNSQKSEIIFEILAKILREQREKQGKSIRLLADEFEIQKSLISRLENGVNEPKLISLWTLCEALDIKLSELMKMVEDELPPGFTLVDR